MTAAAIERRTGECLCGAVRFEATGPLSVTSCHCAMCRRWGGGPAYALWSDSIRWTAAEPAVYRSSEWAERAFCATCGTSIGYRLVDGGTWSVLAFLLDDQSGFDLTMEIFVEEAHGCYALTPGTVRKTGPEIIAEMAGGENA